MRAGTRLSGLLTLCLAAALLAGDRPGVPPQMSPLPGEVAEVWRIALPPTAATTPVDYPVDGTRVLAPSTDGVNVVDTRTGRVLTAARLPEAPPPRRAGIVGDMLLVQYDDPRSGGGVIAGHRLTDGRVAWTRDATPPVNPYETHTNTLWVAARGAAVVDEGEFTGIDPRTGRTAWRLPRAPDCWVGAIAASQRLLFMRECRGRIETVALDPDSGRTAWVAPSDTYSDPQYAFFGTLTTAGPYILAAGRARLDILHVDGALIATRERDDHHQICGPCELVYTGTAVAFGYAQPDGTPAGEPVTEAVAVDTGSTLLRTTGRHAYGVGAVRGDALWLHQSDADDDGWPWPIVLAALDIASGRLAVVAFPVAGVVLHASAETVVVVYETPHGRWLAGFRPRPAAAATAASLGGVDPGAWPDACGLLSIRHVRKALGGDVVRRPRPAPDLGVPLPRPVGCDLIATRADAPALRATVTWVCATPQAAQALLDTILAPAPEYEPKPRRLAPGIRLVAWRGSDTYNTAVVRRGAVLYTVTTTGAAGDPAMRVLATALGQTVP